MKFLADENVEWPIVLQKKVGAHGVVLMRFSEESSIRKIEVLDYLLKQHKNKLEPILKSSRKRNFDISSETRKMSKKSGGVAVATLTDFL